MASTISLPYKDLTGSWLHRWIYFLAAGLMYAAVFLRAFLIFQDSDLIKPIFLSLGAWLLLFVGNALLARQPLWTTAIFLVAESVLILFLLLTTGQDFFAFLFAILGMQAMQRYSPLIVYGVIGLSAVLIFLSLLGPLGPLQALALSLIYTGVGAFMAAYIWSTRRAGSIQAHQQVIVTELQEANQQLEFHARQQEQLAAGRERQRLARELHDSVTQTIFSMTLTTQSALLLLERDREQVKCQLDRLDYLSQSALSEMQVLIYRLAPEAVTDGGFVGSLQRHLEERHQLDNLDVVFEVEGDRLLDPAEEAGLFRIAREALNNVVKHAGVSQATIRLHLIEPFWMEVEDRGAGFDPLIVQGGNQMGLVGMGECAFEIGWSLQVESASGYGTRIRVEKELEGENHP